MNVGFPPSRAEGLARLAAFIPQMGAAYAAGRNAVPAPGGAGAVSALSPYVRHRLVLEQELVAAACAAHGPTAAQKFVQEVFWRAYWKGWLESRPAVWTAYRTEVRRGRDRLATESGLRRQFHAATEGETGIDCFDAWAKALVAENWLHNHVRMWFASIWIFTLRLPWALGADFFARHLLDGDPAANTLSWRWVAGLHTPGKHYVARAENIRRFTQGRFDPRGALDEDPAPLTEAAPPPAPHLPAPSPPPHGEVGLLLHIEDLLPELLPAAEDFRVVAIAAIAPPAASVAHGTAEAVGRFREAALSDAASRAGMLYDLNAKCMNDGEVLAWAGAVGRPIITLHAPVGHTKDCFNSNGLQVQSLRRDWDVQAWPWAQNGFFRLNDHIPGILSTLGI